MRVCRLAAGAAAGVLVWCALFCASACPIKTAAPCAQKNWWGVLYAKALLWATDGTDEAGETEWVWPLWDWLCAFVGLHPEPGEQPPPTAEMDFAREENGGLIR